MVRAKDQEIAAKDKLIAKLDDRMAERQKRITNLVDMVSHAESGFRLIRTT